ncbi:hypothetical protein [Sinorhizobium meliloti]|uniref:hypothetical protein n=1 Tax=Rhizobium meliloti TaxID=382 RepID=UPI000FE09598|nr:hypothetical protein [Sinorhizobium meliloti]RVL95592.1 hypothetical protein CN136_19395 [Sinorhizobium meliloti]
MNYHFDTINEDVVLIDPYGNVEYVSLLTRSHPSEGHIEVSVVLVEINDSNLLSEMDASEAVGVRTSMTGWLHENGYTTTIDVDFGSQGSLISGSLSAKSIGSRFLEGDYAPLIDRYQIYWLNADGTGIIEDQKFVSEKAARGYVQVGFIRPFLSIAAEEQHEDLLNGTVYITRTHSHFRDIPHAPRDLLEIGIAA